MGNITPSAQQPQIGTRHQFTWDQTTQEIGVFIMPTYPTPPVISGAGVMAQGKKFTSSAATIIASPLAMSLHRGSDNQTQLVTFGAGSYTPTAIVTAINALFPAPAFAYIGSIVGSMGSSNEQALFLIDKKPGVGDATVGVMFNLNNPTDANKASAFTGFHFGSKTTASAVTTYTTMDDFGGVVPIGSLSNAYTIPAGADTVSILLRVSAMGHTKPILRLLWSDGQSPFDGSVGSLVLNSNAGLPPVKMFSDYGVLETAVDPTPDPLNFVYPLNFVPGYVVSTFGSGYIIDPAYPAQPILDFWETYVIDLKPPPGITQLRLDFPVALYNETDYPDGTAYLPRIQAYAWGSRRGA